MISRVVLAVARVPASDFYLLASGDGIELTRREVSEWRHPEIRKDKR